MTEITREEIERIRAAGIMQARHIFVHTPGGKRDRFDLVLDAAERSLTEQSRIDAAVEKERERCARVVEDHAEGSRGGERILVPRHDGNLSGLGYAAAIRTPTPVTEEGA